jgi:pimeloyl-ACP methyl ester carboxylesterase
MSAQAIETTFDLPGLSIAAKVWGNPNGLPTLALHGWLDNAASFDRLAPLLPNLYLIAVDLPGHGKSSSYAPESQVHFIDFVINIIKLANHLNWDKFALLGHSLGGAIASVLAGTIPDRITHVGIVDGLGPMTTPADHAPMQLRLFCQDALNQKSTPTTYDNIEQPVRSRLRVNQMQESSARIIIERNLKQRADCLWQWRTDPRLLKPSPLHLTEEHAIAFLNEIVAPITVVRPEPGFPFSEDIIQRRIKAIPHINIEKIPGHHHVHLDEPEPVANIFNRFFS